MSGPKSTFLARVAWLVEHPEVMTQNWPSGEHIIKLKLQQAGLISSKTTMKYLDVGKLVSAAKQQIHEKRKQTN